jgi:hypothetical protein
MCSSLLSHAEGLHCGGDVILGASPAGAAKTCMVGSCGYCKEST